MKRLRMAREAVAGTVDYVPRLIRFDAPIFRGASRAAQQHAVTEIDGSATPRGFWLIPGFPQPGDKGDELRARARLTCS